MTEISLTLFSDPQRASRTLKSLHELFIQVAANFSVEEFSHALNASLAKSPDADLAVTNLSRYVEASTSKAALFNDLVKHPMLMDVLLLLLSYSQYFADILIRDPELFRWLTASDALVHARNKDFLRSETERVLTMFQKPERRLDGLKRLYRREILRIGARDILGESKLQTTTEELSHLADVLAESACAVAHQQLKERFPETPDTPYAVIGLGKLGGSELNYSSDIDIIFVYGNEGELIDAKGKQRTYHEYFNAFVERLVVNLSESSAEGHLYRVDTRLRPESGAGPLARSLSSFLLYYESRGELWERQMLIKARPIAGDEEFGEAFLQQLEPFVFPRTFFQNPKEYIAKIKARIEAAIVGEENVKLRPGGIRDVEFIVQALQLINGGKNKGIRSRNSLVALQQLVAEGYLTHEEEHLLTDAYVFFRTIEHRLQTMLNTQTHELPKDERTLTALARKVRLHSADELRTTSNEFLIGVRQIFDKVLGTATTSAKISISSLLEGNLHTEAIAATVSDGSFKNPQKAARNIAAMISGSALLQTKEFDVRARDAFRSIAESLLEDVRKSPNPDVTLQNIALVASSQKFPDQFYRQLDQKQFRSLLLTICAKSPRFAKGLAKNPLLLETLATDHQSLAGAGLISPMPTQSISELKVQEELRAGIRFILDITSFDEMSGELSQLADIIFTTIVQEEFRASRLKRIPLAICALGKYGTKEITFDSDLDVLFIADAQNAQAKDRLEKVATKIVNRFSAFSEDGKLYDVDVRLRPEGRSAPLVVDMKAYLTYLTNRASLWERQSLTRLRFVAGDDRVGNAVTEHVASYVYDTPLPTNWIDDIVAMRQKTETRSRVTGSELLDIKLGAGGMVDIEFIAQMIQLRHGIAAKRLRSQRTGDVLRIAPFIEAELANQLVHSYSLYRRIETSLRVTLEERGAIIPSDDRLDLLARTLNVASGERLEQQISTSMRATRENFLTLSNHLRSSQQ